MTLPTRTPRPRPEIKAGMTTAGQPVQSYWQTTMQTFMSKYEDTKNTWRDPVTAAKMAKFVFVTVIALIVIIAVLVLLLAAGFGIGTEPLLAEDTTEAPLPTLEPEVRVTSDSSVVTTASKATTMTTTDTTMTVTDTTMTPTASTLSPRIVMDEQPLICTMGSKTSFTRMFPPDGLCEYIFFDSVEKGKRNPLASPERWGNDLRTFMTAYARYKTTAFGIGFGYHKAYSLLRQLNTTNSSLLEPFWRKNIFHFGILDTATWNAVQADVELALRVLKALDTHAEAQRRLGNPSFTFLAGVAFNSTWTDFYTDRFSQIYKPHLFIGQGHYFYGDNVFLDCRVMPPTIITRPVGIEANYQHDLTMAAGSIHLLSVRGLSLIWTLSATMKGRWTMTKAGERRDFLSGCVQNTSAPSFGRFSEICRNPRYVQRNYSYQVDAILAQHETDNGLFAYDNEVSLCRKLCFVKARHPAFRFGIAVYDLEYEDFSNSCMGFNKYGAFSRLHAVRFILNYFRTRFNSAPDALGCRELIK